MTKCSCSSAARNTARSVCWWRMTWTITADAAKFLPRPEIAILPGRLRDLLCCLPQVSAPAGIGVPSPENRDLRQLLWHRHRLVQMRTRIMNQLQAVAMNEGYRWKKKLFSEKGRGLLEKLPLAPWASRRRKELLELLDQLDPKIAELTAAVEQEAKKRPEVLLLMTHPGVGPITGLVYVLVIGTPKRFPCGKQIGSYTGLIPCEDSSAGRQRLGHISKQGNTLLRFLLVEAAQAAARCNPDWRRKYLHLMIRREKRIAKVAMARKLAVRLYWMWRNHWQYSQLVEFGSNAGKLVLVHGVK